MCGLFGWQWKPGAEPTKEQREVVSHILTMRSDQRGGQAWGAWTPDAVVKGMGDAWDASEWLAPADSLFGHTRWATHGSNTITNAHPFKAGDVWLAHNGVISNHVSLNSKYGRTFEVDSLHILQHLVDGLPFDEIQAYGAIAWVNSTKLNRIYLARISDSGQLTAALTKQGVLWASEKSAVAEAIEEGCLDLEHYYDMKAGLQHFAADGILYIAKDTPSVLVSSPAVMRHWSSFNVGDWEDAYDTKLDIEADKETTIAGDSAKLYLEEMGYTADDFAPMDEFDLMYAAEQLGWNRSN